MSIAIKINEELYNAAKPVAHAQFRSIPNQIAYWAKIGRTAMDNPDLPVEFIIGILEGLYNIPKDDARSCELYAHYRYAT